MSDNRGEKRRFSRVPFAMAVTVAGDGPPCRATLLDISLHGALVECPPGEGPELDSRGTLTLPLDDGETRIVMDFTVAHRDSERLGLRCEGIDVDSITHLKRLVALNLGDPEAVYRELAHLVGGDPLPP
ncbi:MAG: PilZ domain-containing protein [Gammaproteobacteria bacterium]|nr:PilZ domain-containing protein [Gammaproteobacteria bacterium]